jgi:hypothetical protein
MGIQSPRTARSNLSFRGVPLPLRLRRALDAPHHHTPRDLAEAMASPVRLGKDLVPADRDLDLGRLRGGGVVDAPRRGPLWRVGAVGGVCHGDGRDHSVHVALHDAGYPPAGGSSGEGGEQEVAGVGREMGVVKYG